MGIHLEKPVRQHLIFISILVMLVNVFTTRALLSGSMMVFIAATCIHKSFGKQLMQFFKSPLLLSVSLLFFLPLVSGLWSQNIHEWSHVVRIKLPLLVLPIAFAGNWQLKKQQWQTIAILFVGLIFGATAWSMWLYVGHMSAIHAGYLQAKVIPTPLENDHVRFSWLVAIGIIICYVLITTIKNRLYQVLLGVLAVWFVMYLHVLSARTGLLSFYFSLLLYGVWVLFRYKNVKYMAGIAVLLITMPLIAWYAFPTFQNRIHYFLYDLSYVKSNTYLPGANDGNRMLSLKAGYHILQQHPFGIGAGDVTDSTLQWYHKNVPNMLPSDQLVLPSSEWLIYGAATGWIGIIVFTVVMFVPLFVTTVKNGVAGWAISITAAASFLFDIGLEVQYGVFLYAFILLWYWKWKTLISNSDT